MLNWLEKKFSKTQNQEALQFLQSLKGAEDSSLDLIAVSAVYWANFYFKKGRNLYEMDRWLLSEPLFSVEIIKNIKALQRSGSGSSAVGLHVWLHTARALQYPELRIIGREIWAELSKASVDAGYLCVQVHNQLGVDMYFSDVNAIPEGLESLNR